MMVPQKAIEDNANALLERAIGTGPYSEGTGRGESFDLVDSVGFK
jgi:hypothetical protein